VHTKLRENFLPSNISANLAKNQLKSIKIVPHFPKKKNNYSCLRIIILQLTFSQ